MPEQSAADVVVKSEDCPECNAKKKFVTYADGHAICFQKGCGHKVGTQPPSDFKPLTIPKGLLVPDHRGYEPVRGLGTNTLRRYGAFMGNWAGGRQLVTPVFDNTGVMVDQQVRLRDGSMDYIKEDAGGRQLLGQHVYGDRNDKRVVVHSDILDAMSTAQVTKLRIPCVSVLSTDSKEAIRDIKANYRWLDRFGEVILFFKDAPEWQQTAQSIAALFDPGKVKLARIGEFKGSNEALQAHQPGDIESAIYAATPWRPVGIVNAKEGRELLFKEGLQVPCWPYPWPEFNEKLLGMRPGECTYHIGGTGIAKTTLMFHYGVHLLKWEGNGGFIPDQPDYPVQPVPKIGWMGFEDLTKQVKVGMLGIHAGKMLSLEPVTDEEGLALFDDLFGDGRLELYDPEQAEYGLEAILAYSRYMRRALDCVIQFFDPLTFIVSQLPVAARTQEEEKLAGRLAAEAKSMGVSYHIGYHLKKPDGTPHEEGRPIAISDVKGSGALTHFAHNVIGYERNQQGSRPDLLRVRSLKSRFARFTGEVCILKYDMDTGRYTPTDEEWPDDENAKAGFTPVPRSRADKKNTQDY